MPSLIPLLLVHHDLPPPVLASLKIVLDATDPQLRARARQVAGAGLRAAYDLSDAEVSDLIDPVQASSFRGGNGGNGGSTSPRRTSPSSARAHNT
jgi:hypothetical protein